MRSAATAALLGLTAMLAACGGGYALPTEPRYATRMEDYRSSAPIDEVVPPLTTAESAAPSDSVLPPAPTESVEAEALPSLGAPSTPPPPPPPSPPSSAPIRPGEVYVVQPGDTLSGVGRRFGTPVRTLMALNGLPESGQISAGARLILPDGVRDNGPDPYATGPSPIGAPASTPPSVDVAPPPPPRETPPPPQQTPPPPPPVQRPGEPTIQTTDFPDAAELQRRAAGRFVWPVRGEILTRFGALGSGLRSDGVNIGAPAGTEVVAAAGGRVAYAGDSLPGLGTTVVIVHGDGWVTAYSHLGASRVRMEQTVTQGQVIGTTGTSGGVTQPQVHFEIRYTPSPADRPRPVDPVPLLGR